MTWAWVALALAHTPDVATARLTLRDDHLEIAAEIDLLALTGHTATALATGPDALLDEALARARDRLERGATATADGRPLPLRVRALPTPVELRAMAATASARGEEHGARVRLALDAPEVLGDPRALTLALPSELGPVSVSLVEPQTAYAAPGGVATFARPRPSSAPAALAGVTLGALLTLLATRSRSAS